MTDVFNSEVDELQSQLKEAQMSNGNTKIATNLKQANQVARRLRSKETSLENLQQEEDKLDREVLAKCRK